MQHKTQHDQTSADEQHEPQSNAKNNTRARQQLSNQTLRTDDSCESIHTFSIYIQLFINGNNTPLPF